MVGENIMDAKAENSEAATEETATELEEQGSTGTRNAAKTIEERLDLAGPAPEDKPDEESEAEDQAPDADADGQIKEGEVEGLSAKAQAKINERIHELNVKRKNAEAAAAAAAEQLKALESKLSDEHVQAIAKMGLYPEYVSQEEAKTLSRFENLRAWKRWCRTHRDGYEGAGTKEDPSMTPEQVADREAAIEDELLDVAGPARTLWLERAKQMREDMLTGRKLRLGMKAKGGDEKKPPLPKPPKLPEGGGAPRRPPVSGAQKAKAGFNADEFKASGGNKDALQTQYEKIFGGGT